MPRLILHTGLKSVKDLWVTAYGDGTAFTPFQDFDYCRIVEKFFLLSTKQLCRNVVYEVRDDEGRTVLLLPLHLWTSGKAGRAYLWGEFSQAGYLDVLSTREATAEALRFALEGIAQGFERFEFLFTRVRAGCRLDQLIESAFTPEEHRRQVGTCVHIPLPGDYDTYVRSLGKNHRQTLRTSVNRLNGEGLAWEVKTFVDQPMPLRTQFRLFDLYWRRMTEKGINFKLRKYFPYVVRAWFNPAILALTRLPNAYYSVLHIGGEVAGFCAGFTSPGGRVTLPFLAIHGRFSRFSPGGLLITGSVRYLIENTNYTEFDLSRGDEKYKTSYGGVPHLNHDYTIRFPGPA